MRAMRGISEARHWGREPELRARSAVALFLLMELPAPGISDSLPASVIVGSDMPGRAAREFFGDAALADGANRRGVFVADRYGELLRAVDTPQPRVPPSRRLRSGSTMPPSPVMAVASPSGAPADRPGWRARSKKRGTNRPPFALPREFRFQRGETSHPG